MAEVSWGNIVEVAARCWSDVVDAELAIAVHVCSLLDWAPLCAFRSCHAVTAQAFELWAAQPVPSAELSWVRVPRSRQADCLRFLGQHCRNARHVAVWETAHFGERLLLRLVCGMRLLESLAVDASPFGGSFPEPQKLLDRLAKYCPRLQHLSISFRHQTSAARQTLEVRALALLGRRLLTLDLGAVAVRVAGGSKTLAACCPQLERLCAQLRQQHEHPFDVVDPNDIARGCSRLQDLDLAPIDWNDTVLARFAVDSPRLERLALRHVTPDASEALLAPLLASKEHRILVLHLALHARSDPERALAWLDAVSQLVGLRNLCLDYAAPLRLEAIVSTLRGGAVGVPSAAELSRCCCGSLVVLTVHGCHGVDDDALLSLAKACPQLQQLRVFPDSWREVGDVSDTAVAGLLRALPRLRSLSVGSRARLLATDLGLPPAPCVRSLSLFAPLDDAACALLTSWRCLRHLWLGPHKLMQAGVAAESSISDEGLTLLASSCTSLLDLTVASLRPTDHGLSAVLRACRDLRRLRIGGRGVTDETLKLLASLSQPRMERFALWFSGVSAEGLRRAEEEMPWTYFDVEVLDSAE